MIANPKHVDEVNRATTEAVASFGHMTHLERAMGMALTAAHEVFHDDASEDDFVKIALAAWKKTVSVHQVARSRRD